MGDRRVRAGARLRVGVARVRPACVRAARRAAGRAHGQVRWRPARSPQRAGASMRAHTVWSLGPSEACAPFAGLPFDKTASRLEP